MFIKLFEDFYERMEEFLRKDPIRVKSFGRGLNTSQEWC